MKKLNYLILISILLSLTACQRAQEAHILFSKSKHFQLTLAPSMREYDKLNSQADLQAADLHKELYVIVLREPLDTLPAAMNLQQYLHFASINITNMLSDAKKPKTAKSTMLDNFPALSVEIHGKSQAVSVVYILTAIKSPNAYYQILAWTLEPRFKKQQAELQHMIDSFKELPSKKS